MVSLQVVAGRRWGSGGELRAVPPGRVEGWIFPASCCLAPSREGTGESPQGIPFSGRVASPVPPLGACGV